jgi:hypothetical protein
MLLPTNWTLKEVLGHLRHNPPDADTLRQFFDMVEGVHGFKAEQEANEELAEKYDNLCAAVRDLDNALEEAKGEGVVSFYKQKFPRDSYKGELLEEVIAAD